MGDVIAFKFGAPPEIVPFAQRYPLIPADPVTPTLFAEHMVDRAAQLARETDRCLPLRTSNALQVLAFNSATGVLENPYTPQHALVPTVLKQVDPEDYRPIGSVFTANKLVRNYVWAAFKSELYADTTHRGALEK